MQAKKDWKKVVFEEADGQINIRQGYFSDEGEFIRLIGDHTESLIRKDKIISITGKLAGGQDGISAKKRQTN